MFSKMYEMRINHGHQYHTLHASWIKFTSEILQKETEFQLSTKLFIRLCKTTVSNDHNDPVGICSVLASTLLVHCSRKISCRCNCSICCSTLFRSSAYLPKLPKSTELWDELQKSVGNKVKIFQCLQKPRLKVKSVKSVQFAALNTYNLQIGMLTIWPWYSKSHHTSVGKWSKKVEVFGSCCLVVQHENGYRCHLLWLKDVEGAWREKGALMPGVNKNDKTTQKPQVAQTKKEEDEQDEQGKKKQQDLQAPPHATRYDKKIQETPSRDGHSWQMAHPQTCGCFAKTLDPQILLLNSPCAIHQLRPEILLFLWILAACLIRFSRLPKHSKAFQSIPKPTKIRAEKPRGKPEKFHSQIARSLEVPARQRSAGQRISEDLSQRIPRHSDQSAHQK